RAALNRGLPIHEARALTAAMMPAGATLIVAAHCHSFISAKTRSRAELGALGFHPSLLPRHRGRSAIEWSIRFGERTTGGTVYWLNDVVDGGPIAAQEHCFIQKDDSARDLWARELAPRGLRLFRRVFDDLERGIVRAIPQDPELATWEPAIDGVPPLWRPDVPQIGTSRFQRVIMRE
ncbi:MAG: formyltransferase family protein, partial [Chthoniobacteraceae bacterium]